MLAVFRCDLLAPYLGFEHSRAIVWGLVLVVNGEMLETSFERFGSHREGYRGCCRLADPRTRLTSLQVVAENRAAQ
jgi:hypothetical protein